MNLQQVKVGCIDFPNKNA